MENMAKGCGRSDRPGRMPRILIPMLESVVNNLTSTSYTSTKTVYNTFNVPVGSFLIFTFMFPFLVSFKVHNLPQFQSAYCTSSDFPATAGLATMSVCPPLPASPAAPST